MLQQFGLMWAVREDRLCFGPLVRPSWARPEHRNLAASFADWPICGAIGPAWEGWDALVHELIRLVELQLVVLEADALLELDDA